MNDLSGGELIQHLNSLNDKHQQLMKDYRIAHEEEADAQKKAKSIKIEITRVQKEIDICKYNIKAERM